MNEGEYLEDVVTFIDAFHNFSWQALHFGWVDASLAHCSWEMKHLMLALVKSNLIFLRKMFVDSRHQRNKVIFLSCLEPSIYFFTAKEQNVYFKVVFPGKGRLHVVMSSLRDQALEDLNFHRTSSLFFYSKRTECLFQGGNSLKRQAPWGKPYTDLSVSSAKFSFDHACGSLHVIPLPPPFKLYSWG